MSPKVICRYVYGLQKYFMTGWPAAQGGHGSADGMSRPLYAVTLRGWTAVGNTGSNEARIAPRRTGRERRSSGRLRATR